jgi:hypothetical protein
MTSLIPVIEIGCRISGNAARVESRSGRKSGSTGVAELLRVRKGWPAARSIVFNVVYISHRRKTRTIRC